MTVRELYAALNERIPPALSCDWDNDGLMCCPSPDRTVHRVLVTLDVTGDAIAAAKKNDCQVILSHHPMIFRGLKTIDGANPVSQKVIDLIAAGIAVMSFHTRLDAVEGGVNDTLATCLGLQEVLPFGEEGLGRIGTLSEPMKLCTFASQVKEKLAAPAVFVGDGGLPVCRVAVLGGSGGDDIDAAKAAGADTYVSGNLGYHALADAPEQHINLVEAGHFFTEQPICAVMEQMVAALEPAVECIQFYSDRIVCF